MNFHVIKTEDDYDRALAIIDELIDCPVGSAEAADLELVSILVEDYERQHYKMDLASMYKDDPVDAICVAVDSMRLSTNDLVPYIGSKSKVNEILERKRNLTLPMIKKLHKNLHIPAEVLLQESKRKVA
jgi:HTH-type transcriptional regulator/antitoxin HigA